MRDVRLLVVLLAAMAIIVVGGVMVPVLLDWGQAPAGPASPSMMTQAAESKAEEPAAGPMTDLDRLSEAFRAAAKRVGPAVVAISTSQTVDAPAGPFGGMDEDFMRRYFGMAPGEGNKGGGKGGRQKFQRQGLGSGVILDPDGFILTNNHVVAEADEISVHLADGRDFKATVVGRDQPTDIAVIRIKAEKLPVAELGDSDKLEVGDWVLAIGAPFGLDKTVTAGIISATGRSNVGIADYESFLQTDAAINPGNSGGPLVNMRGQVVGINTAIASRSGGYMGIGFAVPVNLAREVMKAIREKGEVVRGWLGVGIQQLTPELAESMKIPADQGVLVSQIFEGGPGDKAGIKTGDIVVEFNGKPVKKPNELQNAVAWIAPGTKVPVVVLRDGKRETLKVTVEKRTEEVTAKAEPAVPGAPAEIKDLGIEIGSVTPEAAERYGYKPGQGVLITDMDPAGLGARANLRPGMLILKVGDQKVTTVAEFKAALKKADLAKGVPLLVRAGDRQMFVLIKKR